MPVIFVSYFVCCRYSILNWVLCIREGIRDLRIYLFNICIFDELIVLNDIDNIFMEKTCHATISFKINIIYF